MNNQSRVSRSVCSHLSTSPAAPCTTTAPQLTELTHTYLNRSGSYDHMHHYHDPAPPPRSGESAPGVQKGDLSHGGDRGYSSDHLSLACLQTSRPKGSIHKVLDESLGQVLQKEI
ncbi:unnamed protein product [Pleuronectes platessa]|uniref:Uncharacterized protein n=1 Tax=Pleuronectes platessa TaxID=8262 RepID=A0A9N7TXN5_PLEPL|nr:unnamed protein product [Pleuronectes platessa]